MVTRSLISESCLNNLMSNDHMEQLLIIGPVPEETKNIKPKILYSFPNYQIPEINTKTIIHYAMPNGLKKKKIYNNKLIQDQFVFLLTSNNIKLYGFCVHILPTIGNLPFYTQKELRTNIFCFCLISKIPSFSTHFSFLKFLINDTSNLYKDIFKISCSLSTTLHLKGPPIQDLINTTNFQGYYRGIKVPQRFTDILALYFQNFPGNPSINLSESIQLHFPPTDPIKSILYSSLDTLFSILDPLKIIDLLTAMFLDRQILIIGNSFHEISLVVFSLLSLIEPLEYLGLVIPVLPKNKEYLPLLQAPIPFLIGTQPFDELCQIDFHETAIFVNLDNKIINSDSNFPQYPNKNKIYNNILKIIKENISKSTSVYNFPFEYIQNYNYKYYFPPQITDQISIILKEPLNLILSDYIFGFFMTDLDTKNNITCFNKEIFLSTLPNDQIPFFKNLFISQTFEFYLNQKKKEYMVLKGIDII